MLVLMVAAAASRGCGGTTAGARDAPGNGGSGGDGGAAGTSSGGLGGTDGGAGGTDGGAGGSGGTDGGAGGTTTGGTGGSCGAERLTAAEATSLYRSYAFDVQPDLNPTTIFEASELDVVGLWEGLRAQLFHVRGTSDTGGFFRNCTVLTHDCQVFVPAGECSQFAQALSSGLVANGAFYFSWGTGSGVLRSQIGKLVPNGTQFTRSVSPGYIHAGTSPSRLILQLSASNILVFRTDVGAFNQWSSTLEHVGWLRDLGDTLTIVDDAGQPIPSPLP
jgi:hypothetical protein